MSEKSPQPRCPICRDEVEGRSTNDTFPFCSNRCKMQDLAKWLGGDYRLPMTADSTERNPARTAEQPDHDE